MSELAWAQAPDDLQFSVMNIRTTTITETTTGFCDIIDITAKVKEFLERENVQSGLASLFVNGSTAGIDNHRA